MKYKENSYFKSYSNVSSETRILNTVDTDILDLDIMSVGAGDISELYRKEIFVLRECLLKKEKEIVDLQQSNSGLKKKVDQLSKQIEDLNAKSSEIVNCNILFDKIVSSFNNVIPELSFSIANKIFRGTLDIKYIDIIRSVLNKCRSLLNDNLLNIKIEVNSEIISSVEKIIEDEYMFKNLEIIPNSELDICDCKLYWDYGYIESISSEIVNKILSVIK